MFEFFIIICCIIILALIVANGLLSDVDNIHYTVLLSTLLVILSIIFTTIICNKIANENIVKALNNELQYDTLLLDKNGKLLEIELK